MITLDYINVTLQVSQWKVVTTGYLAANCYKRGKGQVTRHIESTCQFGQKTEILHNLNSYS